VLGFLIGVVVIVVALGAIYLGPAQLAELAGKIVSGEKKAEAPREPLASASAREPLFDDLGTLSWPVTTKSPLAQAYFDQGLRWAYAFNHSAARRAFQEAQRQDPDCAMCVWGEAYVLGPNINTPMPKEAIAPALDAINRAKQLSGKANAREAAIIDATALRYSVEADADQAALNKAYADALAKAHVAFPDDQDLAVLSAEAIMNLAPWDYWQADGKTPKGDIGTAIETIKTVLTANPDHPGAIHFYIHLTEASTQPEAAVPYAERLAQLMPGAGHLVHMGAHTFYRIGRFKDSVELNKKAVEADDRYFAKVDDASSMWRVGYHVHNIHFVVVSAFMTGDKATALEYAKRLQSAVSDNAAENAGWIQLIKQAPYLVNAHLSEPDTVLAMQDPGEAFPFVRAMWRYARGIALARSNRLDEARAEAAAIAALEARKDITYPEDIAPAVAGVLQIARLVVEGRIAEAEGDDAAAVEAYRKAVAVEDTLPYLEPPYWYYPVRQSLGAALMRAKKPADAQEVFQTALARVPNNGWALYGLMQAQQALGDEASMIETQKRFKEAWAGDPAALDMSRL
jgi:tetratricopeptide (TPR) repeat protein